MNKFIAVIIAVFALNGALAANLTTSATGMAACPAATASFNTTNCAVCNTGGTYCTACNVGYQLAASSSAAYSNCLFPCSGSCVYCFGSTVPAATTSAAGTLDNPVRSSGNIYSYSCQLENITPAPTTVTQAQTFCKPVTIAGTLYYSTPSAVDTTTNSNWVCWACSVAGCTNCASKNGALASSGQTTCNQCADGYYLDSNQTTTDTTKTPNVNTTQGTACTACGTISQVTGTTSNSAFVVVGMCNKCVNKTGCVNATCTRFLGTTAGTGSSDTTSYTFDVAKQTCVPKSAGKLAVAFVGAVAFAFVALF